MRHLHWYRVVACVPRGTYLGYILCTSYWRCRCGAMRVRRVAV